MASTLIQFSVSDMTANDRVEVLARKMGWTKGKVFLEALRLLEGSIVLVQPEPSFQIDPAKAQKIVKVEESDIL